MFLCNHLASDTWAWRRTRVNSEIVPSFLILALVSRHTCHLSQLLNIATWPIRLSADPITISRWNLTGAKTIVPLTRYSHTDKTPCTSSRHKRYDLVNKTILLLLPQLKRLLLPQLQLLPLLIHYYSANNNNNNDDNDNNNNDDE